MQNNQSQQVIGITGNHYPKKMRHGWCVAHPVTVCGVTIEHFGAKYPSYAEAFQAACALNRQEAEATIRATAAAADAALRSPKACKPQPTEGGASK